MKFIIIDREITKNREWEWGPVGYFGQTKLKWKREEGWEEPFVKKCYGYTSNGPGPLLLPISQITTITFVI